METRMRTLADWAKVYEEEHGVKLNLATVRKRRALAGVGTIVPPKTYIMTWDEFLVVMSTPLPMCSRVVGA